jgi:2-desacetyl-2-hydroxyethyl bacteriochlorophyllide A dehydrogenase
VRGTEAMHAVKTATMRAAVLDGPAQFRVDRVTVPEPGPGEVRVKLEGSGVCGSSLPVWEGRPWFNYPLASGAPGHEGWGIVDAVGPGPATITPGRRVAMLSYQAFAEYDIARSDAVVPLPAALADLPCPGEALGCAMNVFRRSTVTADQVVVIVGIGFLGAVLVRLAVYAGTRVVAVSRRDFALQVAREQGAHVVLPLTDSEAVEREVHRLTDGNGADRVIEATGQQGPLDLASRLVRNGGRLVIAGYHQDGLRTVDMQSWNWRGIDVINAHERDPRRALEGMRDAISALIDGRISTRGLYTHCFPLERTGEALEMLRQRPDGFLKAMVLT